MKAIVKEGSTECPASDGAKVVPLRPPKQVTKRRDGRGRGRKSLSPEMERRKLFAEIPELNESILQRRTKGTPIIIGVKGATQDVDFLKQGFPGRYYLPWADDQAWIFVVQGSYPILAHGRISLLWTLQVEGLVCGAELTRFDRTGRIHLPGDIAASPIIDHERFLYWVSKRGGQREAACDMLRVVREILCGDGTLPEALLAERFPKKVYISS
jgi:hypothetical protein